MQTRVEKIAMGCKPDPYHFDIIHLEHINGQTIIIANYGGATFNGNKLMVLRGEHHSEDFTTLDPHFLDEDYWVVARFVPTEEGIGLARNCANQMKPLRTVVYDLFETRFKPCQDPVKVYVKTVGTLEEAQSWENARGYHSYKEMEIN